MIQRHELTAAEMDDRLARNRDRLLKPYYQMPEVFQSPDADWPGDKEGRALLAFVSHYKATGYSNPCMEQMLEALPAHTNAQLYFGPDACEEIFEQQLSGHSWLLRGLCEHYEQFGDAFSRRALESVTEGLYLPTAGRYAGYPVERDAHELATGGVSGHTTTGSYEGWRLSTDVGCAFMSIDGLSHVYKITRDARVRALLDEMITVYCAIDKVRLRAQTHCTLTAARGMVRMYDVTGEPRYLSGARDIFNLYVFGGGMDAVFQNLNWWGRPDTWTEPCAIVDSLMLSGELYRVTGREMYRRCAARIFRNGLASSQREPTRWCSGISRALPTATRSACTAGRRPSAVPCGWRRDCGTRRSTAPCCTASRSLPRTARRLSGRISTGAICAVTMCWRSRRSPKAPPGTGSSPPRLPSPTGSGFPLW